MKKRTSKWINKRPKEIATMPRSTSIHQSLVCVCCIEPISLSCRCQSCCCRVSIRKSPFEVCLTLTLENDLGDENARTSIQQISTILTEFLKTENRQSS